MFVAWNTIFCPCSLLGIRSNYFIIVYKLHHQLSFILCLWFLRFALDIDIDAPKVRIPLRASGSSKCSSHFLLDFGNFTLTTMVSF